jgi:hypothetical protein
MQSRLNTVEVVSMFEKGPCYRYIRRSDELPVAIDPGIPGNLVVAPVKLFNPTGLGTWWLASFDPDTGIAYGVVDLHEREAGDFDVLELVEYRGLWDLPIERDLHYSPSTIAELLAQTGRGDRRRSR